MRADQIESRMEELRREIAALEAVDAPCNEPLVRQLRAQLRELEALLAGDPSWRAKMRKRRVVEAIKDFNGRQGRRKG